MLIQCFIAFSFDTAQRTGSSCRCCLTPVRPSSRATLSTARSKFCAISIGVDISTTTSSFASTMANNAPRASACGATRRCRRPSQSRCRPTLFELFSFMSKLCMCTMNQTIILALHTQRSTISSIQQYGFVKVIVETSHKHD